MLLMRGSHDTDVDHSLIDWMRVPVRQMGSVVTGKALAVNAPGARRPYLRTRNVFDGRIDVSDVLSMPMSDEEFERFEARPGDILLNEGQSLELVGRCAMYRGEYHSRCAIQNQLIRFRAREGVSNEFACHLFRWCQRTGVFARIALQTTSIAHLGGKRFERLVLPWPTTEAEQIAIAAALSDVDGLIASLDRLIAKKRVIKLAAMQQLLTGKTRLPGFSGKWKSKTLGDLAKCLRGVSYDPERDLAPGDGDRTLRLLRSNNVQDALVTSTDVQFVDNRQVTDRQIMMRWDILICTANGSRDLVGKAGLFSLDDGHRYTFGAFMGCLRTKADVADPRFVYNLVQTWQFREYVTVLLAGSSINNLKPSSIEEAEFEVPDLDEQLAIADALSEVGEDIAVLVRRRDKAKAIKQGMMQALLTGRIRLRVEPATSGGKA